MSRGAYGKLYRSTWDGTLGPPTPPTGWQVLAFLLAHCSADGRVEMTRSAIAQRSGMRLEHVEEGLAVLEAPDPESRTPGEDGRRLVRLDSHRSWGWRIVNLAQYRDSSPAERSANYRERHRDELRDAERDRSRERRRDRDATVTDRDGPERSATDRDHAEAEAEADSKDSSAPHTSGGDFAPPDVHVAEEMLRRYRAEEAVAARVHAVGHVTYWIYLPLKDGSQHPVSVADVVELVELFPALDVMQALRSMRAFLLANPPKRKTRRGARRFISGWLTREARGVDQSSLRRTNHRRRGDDDYTARNLGEDS